jgi:hypothetical protein|tara:strand:- start:1656 stop:2813 length:1158 start_codon:yes stop_codon:yes gene_type:complete
MAFNIGAFGAGFANKLSSRIDEERVRSEELQDETRREATQVRLRNQAKRDAKKATAEEYLGAFKALGLSDAQAAELAAQGKTAGDMYLKWGQKALENGDDVSELFKFSSVKGDGSAEDGEVINSTIDATATPGPIGSLEATSEANTTAPEGGDILLREFGINTKVVAGYYPKPGPKEKTFSGRLFTISNKLSDATENTDVTALKAEQTQLLADLKAMKDAERAEAGTTTPSFTLGTISANVSEIRRGALAKYGFKISLEDEIENLTDGNQHLEDVATIEIAYQLQQRNLGINDPNMNNTAAALHTTALSRLKSYGFDMINDATKATKIVNVPTASTFASDVVEGKYKAGQVVQTTNDSGQPKYVVYTGIPDFKTGMPFIIISGGE